MIPDIIAGETISIIESFDGFDPSADTLTIDLVSNGQQHSITGQDNGDGSYLIEVAANVTTNWQPGDFYYQALINKAGKVSAVKTGKFKISPSFADMTSGFDNRSHVKKVLDALEAMLEGKASQDQISYSIAGRSLSRMSPDEILRWRDKYRQFLRDEEKAEALAKGDGISSKIFVRLNA